MAKRVFLHVGTPKTGTTYLQSVLWANKDLLADQGLLLPLNRVSDHFHLSTIARQSKLQLENMPPHGRTAWTRMMEEVDDWDGDALISHELFSMCPAPRARWCLEQLAGVADEVHTVITGRDLARQIPAEWQQTVKHGRSHRLKEFYALLQANDPSVSFWRVQDLAALMEIWGQGLPPEQVHLVTVPPAGAPRDLLWKRFATLVGIDPDSVDQSVTRPNESLGLVEIETLRRTNPYAPAKVHSPKRQLLTLRVLAEGILAKRPDAQRFAPPAEEHAWVIERGTAMVEELSRHSYDIVGDLDELLPPPEPITGPNPDDVSDSEVAQVAVETISQVLYRTHATETRPLLNQIKEQKKLLAQRTARVQATEAQLRTAWAAYEREYHLPTWKHAARRARNLARSALRRGQG